MSPAGPPIAPLPSVVKVHNQDSDLPVSLEEPQVVAEPARPRPSTVTVIHTGTKWRQVPREVSWETTELWDRGWGGLTMRHGCLVFPSRRLPSANAKPRGRKFEEPWLGLVLHGAASPLRLHTDMEVQMKGGKGKTHLKLLLLLWRQWFVWQENKQATAEGAMSLKGTLCWSLTVKSRSAVCLV